MSEETEAEEIAGQPIESVNQDGPAISRRSDFATVLIVLGVLALVAGGAVLLTQTNVILALYFGGSSVGCFFMAFIVNVLTDIRWFVSRIAEKSMKENKP